MSDRDVADLRSLPVTALMPDPQNAKEHTPVQIDQIVASIEAYGFNDPLGVIEQADGTYLIVEGHGRKEAAERMGLDEVPCLILPSMTVAERKAYAIAHNQTQMITGLDMDVVAAEFERLEVVGDDHVSLGFTDEDVLFLLPEPGVTSNNHNPLADAENGEGGEGGSGEEGDGEGGGGYNNASWKSFIPPVYKTTLRFGSESDQLEFYAFIGNLRQRYLTAATIAERLVLFVNDHAPKEETDAGA